MSPCSITPLSNPIAGVGCVIKAPQIYSTSMLRKSTHVRGFEKRHLEQHEEVIAYADGKISRMSINGFGAAFHVGSVVVTDRRVVFYKNGWFGKVFETVPLVAITSLERKSLFGYRTMRMHTSHDDLTFKSVQRAAFDLVANEIERRRGQREMPPPLPISSPRAGPADELMKLAELARNGHLTQEEFEAAKRRILS